MTIVESDIAWMAGLFEGEGSIQNIVVGDYGRTYLRAKIDLTDLDILQRCQDKFGGKIYGPFKKAEVHHKDAWGWNLMKTQDVIEFCEMILPYMGVRRTSQIEKALAAVSMASDVTEEELFWRHVDVDGDHWLWTGAVVNGYGRWQVGGRGGRAVQSHRYLVDTDRRMTNECGEKLCVNPDHWKVAS